MLRRRRILFSGSGSSSNPYANIYLTTFGITNPTEVAAVNTLFDTLEDNAIRPRLVRLYLCSPTSSAAGLGCAISLTSMINVNSVVHGASGWGFDNTTNYLDTNYVMSAPITTSGFSCGIYYSVGQILDFGGGAFCGALDGFPNPFTAIQLSGGIGAYNCVANAFNGTGGAVSADSPSLSTALMHSYSRVSSNDLAFYFNGVQSGATDTAVYTNTLPTSAIYWNCINFSGSATSFPSDFSTANVMASAFIGIGLAADQMSVLYAAINVYNTALSRGH